MTRFLLKLHHQIVSHLMAPNLVIQLGINPFSFGHWFYFAIRKDAHTDDRVMDMSFMSLRLIFSYSDPRRIRHEMEHAVYEGILRKIYSKGLGQAELKEALEKVADLKPDCAAYDKEVGMTESGYIPRIDPQVHEVKSEEDLDRLMKELGVPEDNEQIQAIRGVLKAMKKDGQPPEA